MTRNQLQAAREKASAAAKELRDYQEWYRRDKWSATFGKPVNHMMDLQYRKEEAQREAEKAVIQWIAQGCREATPCVNMANTHYCALCGLATPGTPQPKETQP